MAYHAMFSGYPLGALGRFDVVDSIPEGMSVFSRLKEGVPDLTTVAIISRPTREGSKLSLSGLLYDDRHKIDYFLPDIERSSFRISKDIVKTLLLIEEPFFIFANVPSVDEQGWKWREGAELYSESLIKVDKVIQKTITVLKELQCFDQTIFIITTSFGYFPKSQILSPNLWVISSEKIRYKGSQLDIVPTIYRFYGIPFRRFSPILPGSPIIY